MKACVLLLCSLAPGCATTQVDALRTTLPGIAVAARELCKSLGDGVLDAQEARAITDEQADVYMQTVFAECERLGGAIGMADSAARKLAEVPTWTR